MTAPSADLAIGGHVEVGVGAAAAAAAAHAATAPPAGASKTRPRRSMGGDRRQWFQAGERRRRRRGVNDSARTRSMISTRNGKIVAVNAARNNGRPIWRPAAAGLRRIGGSAGA
eukprot:scaffold11633_cov81-Isochrysis_galbana.AAC.2